MNIAAKRAEFKNVVEPYVLKWGFDIFIDAPDHKKLLQNLLVGTAGGFRYNPVWFDVYKVTDITELSTKGEMK
jgi:hypothetical protein